MTAPEQNVVTRSQTGWTGPHRLARLIIGSVAAFALASLTAVGISRFGYLAPQDSMISPHTFGQLLAVHRLLLKFFVLLPAIPIAVGLALLPSWSGSTRLAYPRLGFVSACLFILGGALVLWAFLQGGVETGWAYAVGNPATRYLVSPAFLLGLFAAILSMALMGMNLLATVHRTGSLPSSMFGTAVYWTYWLMVISLPLAASAVALGLVERGLGLGLFDAASGGEPTFLVFLYGLSSTPMQTMALLSALGVCCAVLRVQEVLAASALRRMRWYMAILAGLSLLAIDVRAMPSDISFRLSLLGTAAKIASLVPLYGLLIDLLLAVAPERRHWGAARLCAGGAVLLVFFFAPLDVFLGMGATAVFTNTYLTSALDYFMVTGAGLLALLAGMYFWTRELAGRNFSDAAASSFSVLVMFGMLLTLMPMIPLGLHSVSMDMLAYPPSLQPLQVLVLAGGTILAAGLFCSAMLLLRSRSQARQPQMDSMER